MTQNDEATKERKIKLAVTSSASAVNFGLGVVKVLAGVYTNSLSILTDGVNNFGDVLTNAGAAAGFAVESKRPTERFPGGFGRVEYVVAFVMAIILVAVGGGFAYYALDRVFSHPVVTFSWVQFGVLAGTVVVKIGLAVMFRISAKRYRSAVLRAQVMDSIMDACVTTFAILGLFLSRYMQFPIDALIGLVISVVMIAAGLRLAFSMFGKLVGEADVTRADGLKKLSVAQKGVTDARVRLYDFGTKRAEAAVELDFVEGADEEEIRAAETNIAEYALKHGIKVFFVRSEKSEIETKRSEAEVGTVPSPPDKEGQ